MPVILHLTVWHDNVRVCSIAYVYIYIYTPPTVILRHTSKLNRQMLFNDGLSAAIRTGIKIEFL